MVSMKLLYNPLFPSGFTGYPYEPFSENFTTDNSLFIQGFAKLYNECLAGEFFKGNPIINRESDKNELNLFNLPTFKHDYDYDPLKMQQAQEKFIDFLNIFYKQVVINKEFGNADFKSLYDKPTSLDPKQPENSTLNLIFAELLLLIQHRDERIKQNNFQSSIENSDLQAFLCRLLMDSTKSYSIFAHYSNIIKVEMQENTYFVPQIEKQMLEHSGIRNFLLNKLYYANTLRSTGELTESLKELLELENLSNPSPGPCYFEESNYDETYEPEMKNLNDFPDVRVSLILTLLALGYGVDLERYIDSGVYISYTSQVFLHSNYCRSELLFNNSFHQEEEKCTFLPEEVKDRENIAQQLADYQNLLNNQPIKCPFTCCSNFRENVENENLSEYELEFINSNQEFRCCAVDSVIHSTADEYLDSSDVHICNTEKLPFSTSDELYDLPKALSQSESYPVNYFQARLLEEEEEVNNNYKERIENLPVLKPHQDFQISEQEIEREHSRNVEKEEGLTNCEIPMKENRMPEQTKRLTLEPHSNGQLSFDSYNELINEQALLYNIYNEIDFGNREFEFVMRAYEHSLVSSFNLPDILFYGKYFDFQRDVINFRYLQHKNESRFHGLKPSSAYEEEQFSFTQMTALYTKLLLLLNKRIIWANRISKIFSQTIELGRCPCDITFASLPHFFGAKTLADLVLKQPEFIHVYLFILDNKEPEDIDISLLYSAFKSNSFLPLYLANLYTLPDIAMVRQMSHMFVCEEQQFQRTPYMALLHQESQVLQAVAYCADFGHFWRSDELFLREKLNNSNYKLFKMKKQKGIVYQPNCIEFLQSSYSDYLKFEMLEQLKVVTLLNNSYYSIFVGQILLNDKDEIKQELNLPSCVCNNFLFVDEPFVNLQNHNMFKANIYGQLFEKKVILGTRQKDELLTILNINHGYINIERNLTRVLGSILQQVGDIQTSEIVQFVFNSIFQEEESINPSFEEYFSLDLYNIIVQKISEIVPEMLEEQEIPKTSEKSIKKSKKDQKKKEVKEVLTEFDNIQIQEEDVIWQSFKENPGLMINYAANQSLRQREILLENQLFLVKEAKNINEPQFQSITEQVYEFEMLLGNYYELQPYYMNNAYEKHLINSVAITGNYYLYSMLISCLFTLKTYYSQTSKCSGDYIERITGNAIIQDKFTNLGTFWTNYHELYLAPISQQELSAVNADTRNVIYAFIPDIVTNNINPEITEAEEEELKVEHCNYIASDIILNSTIPINCGRLETANAFTFAIISNNSSLLYLIMQHYEFSTEDLLNGLQIACLHVNPFILRILLNYQENYFCKDTAENTANQINSVRKKYNAQNQGHELPLIKADTQSELGCKIVEVEQILTAYFADKSEETFDFQEPMYFSDSYIKLNNEQEKLIKNEFEMRIGGVDKAKHVFNEVNSIIKASIPFEFQLFYELLNNNSKYCIQKQCQCCKLQEKCYEAIDTDIGLNYTIGNEDQSTCCVHEYIMNNCTNEISNFSVIKKNIIPFMVGKEVQECISVLTSVQNINEYIINKRGVAINLTQLKLENTTLFKLQKYDFIPLTTPLTMAAQLFSEGLEQLLLDYKRDQQENIITKQYLNHKDGLGLTALNHAVIVFNLFATKMLTYQKQIDEYEQKSEKSATFSEEMRNCKALFKEATENVQLLLQYGASSYIQDKLSITARDRIVFLLLKFELLLVDDLLLQQLMRNTEFLLFCLIQLNDVGVKRQIDLLSCQQSKKLISNYSIQADQRLKSKFAQICELFNIQQKDFSISLNLQRFGNLTELETADLNFSKPVFEAIIQIIHYLSAEDLPEDFQQICFQHTAENTDIYQQKPRNFTTGAEFITFEEFLRFEEGEDVQQEKLERINVSVNLFNIQAKKYYDIEHKMKAQKEVSSSCQEQLVLRTANRLWRCFQVNSLGVSILRAGKGILNSVNFITREEKIGGNNYIAKSEDDSLLYEIRQSCNSAAFIVQLVNMTNQAFISIKKQEKAVDLDQCVTLNKLLKMGRVYSGFSEMKERKTVVRNQLGQMERPQRITLASILENSEIVSLKLFQKEPKNLDLENFSNNQKRLGFVTIEKEDSNMQVDMK